MPGKDGYALLREVRALPLTSKARVPAAALTSFTETGHRERARQAGFQIHLAKPVASRTLVDAVARLADRTFESVGEQAAAGGDRQG